MKRIVIKIGSNVLTRRDGTLDVTRLSALVDQIAALRAGGCEIVLVSSGAVAAGRGELRGRVSVEGLDQVSARQLFSAVGQAKLINRYYDLFREHAVSCGQVLATKENFERRRHYLNQQRCLDVMLANGVLPIVNENDTVSLTELMFTDNDELSGLIAGMTGADRLIILSNVDGLFTDDPSAPGSRLIASVPADADIDGYISSAHSSAGRGGMGSKCRVARRVASEGIEVIVANGTRQNILLDLAAGADVPHTVFEAAERPASALKKWIAHSDSFAKGSLEVNDGAAQALRRGGNSLLPVGVVSVKGDFDADDIVTVTCGGIIVAWGKSAVDAATARERAGVSGQKPLIHADYLYIDEQAYAR